MAEWELAFAMDRDTDLPVFLQVARAIAEDVRRGRLRPGTRLPGSRSLARALAVHRNTILAAYDELVAEGWLETTPARGTFVAAAIPETRTIRPRRANSGAPPATVPYAVRPPPTRRLTHVYPAGVLDLSSGIPDLDALPIDRLSRAYRHALKADYAHLLGYHDPEGHPGLRAALAAMVTATRGLPATAENIFVTRGSQMAWTLLGHALLGPGDCIGVEELGYRPAWEAFRQSGATVVPLPIDRRGVCVEQIEALAADGRLKAIYLTPHHQYPTTVTLVASRRMQILALAARYRFAIIEDDYDHEFQYSGHPIMPLASLDRTGAVIYVGTLSKVLAPGLRIGFIVAPRALVATLAAYRSVIDMHGDHAVEAAVAQLMTDGEVQRHADRRRRGYATRRDALIDALRADLGMALTFDSPAGGMALWATVAPTINADAWAGAALDRGVAFHTGRRYSFDGTPTPHIRLHFTTLHETDLREAVRRMAAALPR